MKSTSIIEVKVSSTEGDLFTIEDATTQIKGNDKHWNEWNLPYN